MSTPSLLDSALVGCQTEFGSKAALLGHDLALLHVGYEDRIYFTSDSVEDLGKRLRNATEQEALARRATFFQPMHQARSRLGQGVHDRAEAYIFAGGEITDNDREGIARHLPVHAQSIAVAEKVVGPGEVWDLTLRGDRWKCDDRDELYTAVNVGRLILHPGAAIIVRGNILSLLCQEVCCLGDADEFQIQLLPTPFSVDPGSGPHHGAHGEHGEYARPGIDAAPVNAQPLLLGYQLLGAMPEGDGCGGKGRDGRDGADGGQGRNGGMCYLAELTFRNVCGPLGIYSRAGQGGAGGNGGDGGNGGYGGRGRDGYPLFSGLLLPGAAGNGGDGGHGGRGGNGGSGGISSNIYISVPPLCESQVRCFSEASIGGPAGSGGQGGQPGAGGSGGIAHHFPSTVANGSHGAAGLPGTRGANGKPGKSRPGAAFFLNNRTLWSTRGLASLFSIPTEDKEITNEQQLEFPRESRSAGP
ncbi:MAG TPA: hypothetical protein VE178_14755 [Silvibacterium sp.]|nr:hypothetical protein [Silvibacterium sp.]